MEWPVSYTHTAHFFPWDGESFFSGQGIRYTKMPFVRFKAGGMNNTEKAPEISGRGGQRRRFISSDDTPNGVLALE